MTDEISNQERRLQQMDLKLSSVFYSIQHSTVKNQALNTWYVIVFFLISGVVNRVFCDNFLVSLQH